MSSTVKILLSILVCLLVGYLLYFSFVLSKKDTDNVVTIGWIGPLTGPTSPFGIDSLRAVELAIDEYNETRSGRDPILKLVVEDDRYEADRTLVEYQKLKDFEHPVALFMLTYDGVLKVGPKTSKDYLPIIDSLDNDMNLAKSGDNVFLIAKETDALAKVYVKALADHGGKNIAVIYNDGDQFMRILGQTIIRMLNKADIKINPLFLKYHPKGQDFRDILKQAQDKHVDSYLFLGYMEVANAMTQARQMGISAQFYTGSIVTDPDFLEKTKDVVNGTYFAHFTSLDGNQAKAEEFLQKYKQKFNQSPSIEWSAFQSYDAANMLIQAIKKASQQSGGLSRNLMQDLGSLQNYDGISGMISIEKNRTAKGIIPSLYVIEEGQPVKVR